MTRRPLSTAAFFVFVVSVAVACGGGAPPPPQALVIPSVGSATAPPAPSDSDLALAVPGAWNDSDSPIPVSSDDPITGSRDALVTLVLFSDFQCPFCSRLAPTLAQIRHEYQNDDLRIIWKDQPLVFHTNAKPAAEAARGVFELAGNDAFWQFYDKAFQNQSALGRESYVRWAEELGVRDLGAFEHGLDEHRWAAKVDASSELAHSVGANGTPTSFVNGLVLVGAQPYDKFRDIIEQELRKAKAALAAGTPRSRLYVTLSKQFTRPDPTAQSDSAAPDATTVWKIPVDKKQPVRGSASALVTIVEFADFQCPFSAKVQTVLTALRTKYGADLRIVWRDNPLPFHPHALPAAELAREARAEKGDAAFWAVHDELFANHANLEDATLDSIATKAGLDLAKVHAAIAKGKYKAAVEDDQGVAEEFAASGTPHFFINGRRFVGAQPQDKFEAIIDAEMVKARALVQKGTSAANVYEELTKDGKGPPPLEKKTVALPAHPIARGPATAKVTIQEFADFQCPFCGRVEDTLKQIQKDYGSKVRLVWRDKPLPMHDRALETAEAAREAYAQKGATGFWTMHDLLFAKQGELSRATLDGYAQQMSLDMTRWAAALDGAKHQAEIDADSQAADAVSISGTPAFVINGYFVSGAQPYAKFRKIIELALREAK